MTLLDWVEATSGWSPCCCVPAGLQAGAPSFSLLGGRILSCPLLPCFGLNSNPGRLGLGYAGVVLLLPLIRPKTEVNFPSGGFKARKQSKVRTGSAA